jgi:hypothetical protein
VGKIIDFPDAIGVVDATHTQIRRPSINQREYYRLDYACHTYAHQMIVDWKGKIIYLATGVPGSVHDRRIWTHSQPFTHKHNYFSDNQTLLADKGYEADGDWLITLHKRKRNENIWQRQTREARNKSISRHMVIVEYIFALIKNLFGLTNIKFCLSKRLASSVFYVAALLTNRLQRLRGYSRSQEYQQGKI